MVGWSGFFLFLKVLEHGYLPWMTSIKGVAHLTCAQLSMLVEGIDWRRQAWTPASGRGRPEDKHKRRPNEPSPASSMRLKTSAMRLPIRGS
ncbi:hypothetical protein CQ054_21190 [Ochrobactrum sp. MYb29]|uniref:IS66 family insertion sequence element accessory protein TnpB n=1 Tax=Brucella pituitosa TaxID=571256 RepID=UPI000C2809B0|nr:hypothetical protein CWE02_09850 [Brucella pituitosa]PRA80227.1 hypothetical protein CQ054_21190 [Ochrobactrum sp. MYb29]